MPIVRQVTQSVTPEGAPSERLPTQPIPQVEAPQITARPSPDVFGANIGEAVGRVGEQGYGLALQAKEAAINEAMQVRLNYGQKQLQDAQLAIMYGQNGALSKTGINAVGIGDQVTAAFGKAAEDIRKTMPPRIQDHFDAIAQSMHSDMNRAAMVHETSEQAKVANATSAGLLENHRSLAILKANDPVASATEIAGGRQAISDQALREGWPADQTMAAIDTYASSVHLGILNQLLSEGQDLKAKAYFDANRKDLIGDDLTKANAILDSGSKRGESQRQTARIIGSFDTQESAREEAKKIADPEVQDDVLQRINAEFALKKQVARENEEAQTQQAKDAIEQTIMSMEKLIDRRKPVFARDVIPPALWDTFSDSTKKTLESYTRQYQEKEGGGIDTDYATYYRLMNEAATDPQKFAAHDLFREFGNKLNPKGEMKQLQELKNSILKGNAAEAEKHLAPYRTKAQVFDDTLTTAGINPNPKFGTPEAATLAGMRGELDKEVTALETRTGKVAGNPEIQEIINSHLIPGKASSWNIFGSAPFFTQPPTVRPAGTPAPIQPGEVTSTNPKTKERWVLRGNQWISLGVKP